MSCASFTASVITILYPFLPLLYSFPRLTGLDIVTAKPSADERKGIPHHLFDVATPERPLDVMQFVPRADAVIADIIKRGKTPIICGGTFYWVEAVLFENLVAQQVSSLVCDGCNGRL